MVQSVGSEAKVIARHSAVYGLANILDRVVGFLMIPVYTRFLTPADYGVLELIYMTINFIGMIVGLGIETAVSRFYFDYDNQKSRNKVISTAILGYGSMILVILFLLLPFSEQMAKNILDSSDYAMFFVVAMIALALDMIIHIAYVYLRVRQKSVLLMVFSILRTVTALGLNIYFVVFAKKGVYGILLSTLITNALFTIILGLYTLSQVGLKTNYKLLIQMIKFGLPLIPSNISAYVVQASDRYFIKHYASMSLTGLYSLGYKFGILVNQFVTSPFIQIWYPRRFEYFKKEDSDRIYARIFTYFCALSLFVGLLISLLAKDVIRIMATELFWPSYKVVPIIVLSYIVFSFHYHFNVGILMKKATKYVAYINIINAILNLSLNYILIKRYDIWGAAFAVLICYIFKVSLTYYFSNKFYKIHMEWKRVTLLFVTAFAMYFVIVHLQTGSIWINMAIRGIWGCCYPFVLYIMRFFTEDELSKFKQIIKTRKLNL